MSVFVSVSMSVSMSVSVSVSVCVWVGAWVGGCMSVCRRKYSGYCGCSHLLTHMHAHSNWAHERTN